MDYKERIVSSNEDMMRALEVGLERTQSFLYDPRYRQHLGDSFVERYATWADDIRAQKEQAFTIVIAGNFKRGKSTLINALLQEETVPADVTPETMTVNRIAYGMRQNWLPLSGNRRISLSDDELRRDSLERVMSDLNEPLTYLEIRRPNEILKKITLLDTPGLNDAVKDYSELVKESLLRADAIFYVFNVIYPLASDERFFLKNALLPCQPGRIFLIGNHSDNIPNEDDFQRIKAAILSRVSGILPDAELYMISALDEVCRVTGQRRPPCAVCEILEKEFQRLMQDTETFVQEKHDYYAIDKMQRVASAMLDDLRAELTNLETGLKMSAADSAFSSKQLELEQEETIQTQENTRKDFLERINGMKAEAKQWMDEFLHRIENETGNLGAASEEDLRKYYEFYCVDLVQSALNLCLETHQDQLYDMMNDVSASLRQKYSYNPIPAEKYPIQFKVDNRIWTKGDSVGLAVSLLSFCAPLALIASLSVDGISGYLRQREEKTSAPKLIQQIRGKFTALSFSVNQALDAMYSDLSRHAKRMITDYFRDEIEARERFIRQAVDVSKKEDSEKTQIYETIIQARELLKASIPSNLVTVT